MGGNASRYSHQPFRRFSQLILDQGAMVTDADQREAQAIGLRNTTTLGGTSIRTGVPQTGGIVAWDVEDDPSAYKIPTGLRPGRVVADGHVGDVRPAPGSEVPDGPGLALLTAQADLLGTEAAGLDGPLVVYADLWHRPVGAAEDGRLVDPAFLSAQTSTRTELMAQLKLAALDGEIPSEADLAARVQDEGLPRFGSFRLTEAELTAEIVAPDACDPCATTLDDPNQDAGNDLFRLEVHRSGFNRPDLSQDGAPALSPDDARVTLKWSRDNGHVEVPVAEAATLLDDSVFDTAVFELTDLPAEQRMGLYTDGMEDRLATLHARDAIEAAAGAAPDGAMIRVWDGAVTIDLADASLDPQPVGGLSAEGMLTQADGDWTLRIELGGLGLTLVAEDVDAAPYILPGDAWCIEIREYATEDGDRLAFAPEPVEIAHHYCFVGVIEDTTLRVEEQPDMRARAFPALTELDALSIHYDNAESGVEAWTVQGALDLLFDQPPGEADCDCQCTVTIDPERDLAEQLDDISGRLEEGEFAGVLICLPVGRFPLTQPVAFRGSGDVTIRGAGRDLSVIELVRGREESNGAIDFFDTGAVAMEELSLIGALDPVRQEAHWIVGTFDVGRLRLHRIGMRVASQQEGTVIGCVIRRVTDRGASTDAVVTDCLFTLGAGAYGVGVWDGATSLRVATCEFRAASLDTFGSGRSLSASDRFTLRTGVARRTAVREGQIEEGLFAPFPGNSELLLDLTDLDRADRSPAARFWTATLPLLRGADEVETSEDFQTIREGLITVYAAIADVAEAESLALRRRGAEPDGDARVLTALGGVGGAELGDVLRAASGPRGVGAITRPGPILSAAGSAVDPGPDPSMPRAAGDDEALARIEAAGEVLGEGALLADFVERIGPVLRLVPPGTRGPAVPNWGIFAYSERPMVTQIEGNAFYKIDVAIDLVADGNDEPLLPFQVPVPTTIRDNVHARVMRLNRMFPVPWGGQVGTLLPGRHPITLTNYDDVTLEGNAIDQVRPPNQPDDDIEAIYGENVPDGMSSFAAISLRGIMGPKLRGIGNASFNFRHCVYVDCFPARRTGNFEDRPANFWVYRENSALPVVRVAERAPWAVEISNRAEEFLEGQIRLVIADNWLPNPFHEEE